MKRDGVPLQAPFLQDPTRSIIEEYEQLLNEVD